MSAQPFPAVLGGDPIRPAGPPDWPVPDDAVSVVLARAVADGSWGKYDGGHVRSLEKRLAQTFEVRSALACCSGTFAVELALRALQVGPRAEVILSAYDHPGHYLG